MARHIIGQLWKNPDLPAEVQAEVVTVAELTPEQAQELRQAHNALYKFLIGNLFSLVLMNRNHQRSLDVDFSEQHERALGAFMGTKGTTVRRLAITSLANFASMIHAYQEHSEIRAERVGGSGLKDHVKKRFRDHYDSHPALYLMRQVRNVIFHSELDLIDIEAGAREVSGKAGEVESWLLVNLNRERLSQHSRINKALREHMASFGTFTVLDAMDRAVDDLIPLDRELLPLLHPDLYEAALLVTQLDDRLRTDFLEDHSCFLTSFPTEGQAMGATWENFPLVGESMDFAREFMASVLPVTPTDEPEPSASDRESP